MLGTVEEVGKSFRDFFKPLILSLEASVFSVEAEKNYHSLQLTNNKTLHTLTIYDPIVLQVNYPKPVLLEWKFTR